VYAWLWYVQPFIGFVLFMLFTLYHFGQSDTERLPLNGFLKQVFILARGLSIAGLILFGSDPFYTSRIVESVTGISLISIVYNFTTTEDLRLFFALMYPSVFLFGSLVSKQVPLKSWLSLDALVVPALFSLVDPIFAFALYFGLWHGYNHTKTMLDFLSSKDEQIGFGWFYKETALFSAISYIGLVLIYFLVEAFGDEALLVAILFTLISVITLPHMLVVEQMYRAFDKVDDAQKT
jgi:Brp/Blh family beta-carotene 15,15'-monooxygenase